MRTRLRSILPMLAVAAMSLAASVEPGTPPEKLVSLRRRILSPLRYQELFGQWKAWTRAHPDDPVGWSQLARAAMYAKAPCSEFTGYAEKAVRVGPQNAEALATLGRMKWSTYCGDQPSDPSQAIALLERALKLDPTLDDPHYILWSMLRSKGRREDADAHLRTLLDRGQMPEPLVDFGYNLLAGLEPNAILLTNGDNDTYPEIALQAARGFRTDVAVVNVSLLNLQWYRRQLAAGPNPVPVPLLADGDTDARGDDALKGLLTQIEDAGSKRPLYAAVTVSCDAHPIPKTLSLEGVVYRIHSTAPPNEVDAAAMSQNLESRYRLESLTSVTTNWDDWSSLRLLSLNYASAFARMAIARAKAGDIARGRESMVRALEINDFHRGGVDGARWMISSWSNWDPNSPELARWKKKLNL